MKKYQIIYADPPWSYDDKMSGHSFSLDHEYETQSKDWIKTLPIQEICDKDCVLFLWMVSPLLDEGIETLKAWGFEYVTLAFCWIKETPLGLQIKNLGRWTMGGVELVLLGRKGHPKRVRNNVLQTVFDIRTSHSKKPHEVRARIVDLMGDLPRIELFARYKSEGWDVWGNEVNSDIDLLSPPTPEKE